MPQVPPRPRNAFWLALCVGCGSYATETWEGPTILRDPAEVAGSNLLFAGSCSQRRQCAPRSANAPSGQVNWYCDGLGGCTDDVLWVAAPRAGALNLSLDKLCGRSVRICIGDKCTLAEVRDASMYRDKWEVSQGVLSALGVASGVREGNCGAYGGANLPVLLPSGL